MFIHLVYLFNQRSKTYNVRYFEKGRSFKNYIEFYLVLSTSHFQTTIVA